MNTSALAPALVMAALFSAACSSSRGEADPGPGGDIVVVDGDREAGWLAEERDPGFIPPGHYPPPGECRIWYSDRPPGQQPPPQPCDSLGGRVPFGSFLLFDRESWDTRYDWREYERRNPDSVPGVVLRIMSTLARR